MFYNKYIGIKANTCLSCIFHHNNFINNAFDSHFETQAFDTESNTWYDISTNEGNFWSDLVWDDGATYVIGGYGASVDPFPLQFPVVI